MSPVWFPRFAMFLYAVQNVILDRKLRELHPVTLLLVYFGSAFPVLLAAYLMRRFASNEIALPNTTQATWVALTCLLYLCADLFYVGSYNAGVPLPTVVATVAVFPAFAVALNAAVQLFAGGKLPSRWQVLAVLLAPVVVWLANKE